MKNKQTDSAGVEIDQEGIDVACLVNGNKESSDYRRGFVQITLLEKSGILTVSGARALALRLIECAGAAENDELVLRLLIDTFKLPFETAVFSLRTMRSMRPKDDGLPEGSPA